MYSKVIIYPESDFHRNYLKENVQKSIKENEVKKWRLVRIAASHSYAAVFYQKAENEEDVCLTDRSAVDFIPLDTYSCSELNNFVQRSISSHEKNNWRLSDVTLGCAGIFLTFHHLDENDPVIDE